MDNKMSEYILKHTRKRDKELKYDFMPSLLEIIERPSHKAGMVIIIGVFTLLIAAVIWACFSKIDVVITASGSMQPKGNINIVRSYTGGYVRSINVFEGDHVEKGDILIELNTESIDLDEDKLNSQRSNLQVQQEIYKKIINGEDISTDNIEGYVPELKPYIQVIVDNDAAFKNKLLDLEKEKTNAELNLKMAQIQLEEYQVNGMGDRVQVQELVIQQYTLSIEQVDLQISNTKIQYSAQINSQLSQISSQLDEIEASLEKCRLSKDYQQIIAPVSGYVNSIAVNTIGETVTSAEQLITIVPDNTEIEMVCYVQNMDIADVEIGMEVEVKLEAYPYNKYGTVKGVVDHISPSSFVSEQLGNVYLVKIKIINDNENIDILSGLSGSVEIKINKRTVMDYFLEPILRGFGDSLKEK